MNRHVERQRGAILVMTVIFLVILLGFAALALDFGRLYVLRTEMQNAADASAMAAAAELDGDVNAISDAVIAAKQLLSHRGRFATQPELLNILKYDPTAAPEDNAFEFYSWINAELDDSTMPSGCVHPLTDAGTPDNHKCLATSDADAHYVKVKLYPELVTDEEEYFQISLYFLPVLGFFVEDGTLMTATTRVSAVAGAGASMICNYPPIFICKDPGMTIGHQVRVKVQQDSWAPGNFGFLEPPENIINPKNGATLSGNQAFAAALANEGLMGCTPSTVTTNPGNRIGWTRDGLNTRFGIYNHGLFMEGSNPHAAYAAAPNVIDYPRDRDFASERYGSGWNLSKDTGTHSPMDQHYIPSTYNQLEYYQTYHTPGATELPVILGGPGGTPTRYNFYQWELTNTVTAIDEDDWLEEQLLNCDGIGDHCPGFKLDRHLMYDPDPKNPNQPAHLPAPPNGGLPYLRIARSCDDADPHHPTQGPEIKDCTLLDGAPLVQASTGPHIIPQKRVLYVAEIDCSAIDLHGKDSFDVLEYGGFLKFFLTEHIQPPSGGPDEKVDIYAEYLGPVGKTDEKYQELVHTVIQLYE
jgi:hypothetical protein